MNVIWTESQLFRGEVHLKTVRNILLRLNRGKRPESWYFLLFLLATFIMAKGDRTRGENSFHSRSGRKRQKKDRIAKGLLFSTRSSQNRPTEKGKKVLTSEMRSDRENNACSKYCWYSFHFRYYVFLLPVSPFPVVQVFLKSSINAWKILRGVCKIVILRKMKAPLNVSSHLSPSLHSLFKESWFGVGFLAEKKKSISPSFS